jgi:predicted dehydrogenase
LLATPGVDVVAIFGPTQVKVDGVATRLGIAAAFDDYVAMLDATQPDATVIATPNDVHAPMAVEAIRRGIHVLCEKPLGVTLAEATAMYDAAREARVRTAMNFTYRSTTPFRHAWTLIRDGAVGRVRHIGVTFHQGVRADEAAPIAFRMLRERGGGALLDVGPHMVDAMRWLAGDVAAVVGVTQISIPMRPAVHGGPPVAHVSADDVVSFIVRLRSGATGTVQLSQVTHGRHGFRRVEIAGDAGTISLEEDRAEPPVVRYAPAGSGSGRLDPVPIPSHLEVPFAEFPARHVGRMVRALRGEAPAPGEDPWPTFADGLAAQRVLDAVERSATSGRWVNVND